MKKKQVWKCLTVVGPYAGAVTLCLLILAWVMKLWQIDLTIPLGYHGDGLSASVAIKGIIDNGWYLQNPNVGMPTGLDLRDYPTADNFYFLLIKLLSYFTSDYAVILNLFFLLSFPLTTLTALFTFRQFNLSYPSAIVGSLLFTFLPYHFMRGISHLFLSSYYVIPLAVMVILWVYETNKLSLERPNLKAIASVAICLLVASSGVYYAFFTCFFLVVAGVSASLWRKNLKHLLVSGVLIGVIILGIMLNIAPGLLYKYTNGENTEVARRSPLESEIYAMKITQLLLPVTGHRLPFFEQAKGLYNGGSPLVNENDTASLGFIGSMGLAVLLGGLFYRKPFPVKPNLFRNLSELNIAAVLLATMGGLGTLFNYAITPQIRSYNRISVFIAFFSLLALMSLLEGLNNKPNKFTLPQKNRYYGLLGLLLLIGILDQTTVYFIPPYSTAKVEFVSDDDFVQKIEASVPKNAMIFQLPYVPFPESPPVNKMTDYDLFRGYLHSQNLRWSYGAMRGREADIWQRELAAKPVNELVEALSLAGYSGIYLDRFGYTDRGEALEQKLTHLLNVQPISSANNRLAFFNLTEYNLSTNAQYLSTAGVAKREMLINPLLMTWQGGFSGLEGNADFNWRWCSSEGELRIYNTSKRERTVTLEMYFATGYEKLANLQLESSMFSTKLNINAKDTFFSKTVVIPPGRQVIKFSCNADRINAPGDPRALVFRVVNFSKQEEL